MYVVSRLLLRWLVQRPSRASGKLQEQETGPFLATTSAAWSWMDPLFTTGPACSSPPAPALRTSITITIICTLCRLSICRARCLAPIQRARMSHRLTSRGPLCPRRQRLLLRHPAIGGKRWMQDTQDSSQVIYFLWLTITKKNNTTFNMISVSGSAFVVTVKARGWDDRD